MEWMHSHSAWMDLSESLSAPWFCHWNLELRIRISIALTFWGKFISTPVRSMGFVTEIYVTLFPVEIWLVKFVEADLGSWTRGFVWLCQGRNNKNWKEQRPNNQEKLNKSCSSNLHPNPRQYAPQESTFSLKYKRTWALLLASQELLALPMDCSPVTVAEIWQGCRSEADQLFKPVLSGCSKAPGAVEAGSP